VSGLGQEMMHAKVPVKGKEWVLSARGWGQVN
jgi:hypothetical protein